MLEMRRDRDILKLKLEEIVAAHPELELPEVTKNSSTLDNYLHSIQ